MKLKLTATKKLFALLILLVGISYFFGNKLIHYFEQKPKTATELNGIHIGEKLSDVLFKNAGYTLDKSDESKDAVVYVNEQKSKQFVVVDGVVTRIMLVCDYADTSTEYSKIKCNAKGEEVLERFKDDVKILCRKKDDEFKSKRRMYDVEKYGIRFGLEHNKVLMFLIAKPNQVGDVKKETWDSCE